MGFTQKTYKGSKEKKGRMKALTRSNGRSYKLRPNRDRVFFPREWMDFYSYLKPSQKFTFNFLIQTGARINEAINVKLGDIDLINKRIILRITKCKAIKKERNPRPRTIPISTQFSKYLKTELKEYKNEDNIPILSTPAANIAMQKALSKAEINDKDMFSIHNIRKTLENWLLALGMDGTKLSMHFGHDILTAMQHYLNPDIYSFTEKREMKMIIGDLYER